jgi:UV DNA damage repair endonuclease
MARMMGFGRQFQDMKINVHISGRKGAQGIRDVLSRLTPEARNTITIENEEMTHGLDDCLAISDIVPIVLDIHHNWIREGEYISAADDRVRRVVASWRGVRPALHYSTSREDYLVDHRSDLAPDYAALLESGHKKQKLRAHSDFYWNHATTDWALTFWDQFDIQCESKGKNLASEQVYNRAVELGLV